MVDFLVIPMLIQCSASLKEFVYLLLHWLSIIRVIKK